MMSLRSISQIINKARTFCSTPVNKLHTALSAPLVSNIYSQFLRTEPSNFKSHNALLQPSTPLLVNVCGMKVRYVLRRRCKDCRLVFIDGVLHNLCSAYGRHTQRKKMPHWKATMIVTHAMQTKKRPW